MLPTGWRARGCFRGDAGMSAGSFAGDASRIERLRALAERIRAASAAGRVTAAGDVLADCGAEQTPITAFGALGDEASDIEVVASGSGGYLFSTRVMTRRYAEAAARSADGDQRAAIAETVRDDSATYPRPTPLATFLDAPFLLRPADIERAVTGLLGAPSYEDIQLVTASDGTTFLYSTRHLDRSHATSLAEWAAVGRANNP